MPETEVWPGPPRLVLRWVKGERVELDAVDEKSRPAKLLWPKPGEAYDDIGAKRVYESVRGEYEKRRQFELKTN